MRQLATGKMGAGYEIVYAAKDMPEEMQKARAELMQTPANERQSADFRAKAEAFNSRMEAWQKEAASTVANLIIDGVFVGEHQTGAAARTVARDLENKGRDERDCIYLLWETT